MKRLLSWLLLAVMPLSLFGCSTESAPEPTAQVATAAAESPAETLAADVPAETQPADETTEPQQEGKLFLKVSGITFSLVGESEDIYLGLIPREQVVWESEDPAVISVNMGVLTAVGVGSTTVHARYGDRTVSCTAGCLAQTQEELAALDPEILSAPMRLPPQVDLEEPCTYFDDAAIVGDSITYFLWQVESQNNYLGDIQFLTRQGISINGLVWRSKNIYYRGKEMPIEDIAARCEVQRMYIMLGCLDYQVNSARRLLLDNWNTMMDRIEEERPDLDIVIISNIPCRTEETEPSEYNLAVDEFAPQLRQFATDRGYGYVDLGYYIRDHYGRMPAVYSKDERHMNLEGSLAWMQILRHYARFEQEGGSLK